MHICHLITGLGTGGTPVMLRKLLEASKAQPLRFTVIGMIDDNSIGKQIEAMGIPVHRLGMKPGRISFQGWRRLIGLLRRDPPDVLQTWLYHADLLGSMASIWRGGIPVVWNIRHATLTPGIDSRSTLWAARLGARLSRRSPRSIVINTHSGQQVHAKAGYDSRKFRWIPNGFDLGRFRPSADARKRVRDELGLPQETRLIGLVARFSRLKGHDVFIRAMGDLARDRPGVHFLMCGRDIDRSNQELAELLRVSGSADRFHLLGDRQDIAEIQAGLDLAVCPSRSEAFSNSIGEAMACGVPCIASDIGDSAQIIGAAGQVIPAGDPQALRIAVQEFLHLPEPHVRRLSLAARRRIEENFDIARIAAAYHTLWREAAGAQLPVARPSVGRAA